MCFHAIWCGMFSDSARTHDMMDGNPAPAVIPVFKARRGKDGDEHVFLFLSVGRLTFSEASFTKHIFGYIS